MGSFTILMAGIAMSFNLIIILVKLQKGDTTNAIIDASVLGVIMWLFSGSLGALVIGAVASAIFSMYLLAKPVKDDAFDNL